MLFSLTRTERVFVKLTWRIKVNFSRQLLWSCLHALFRISNVLVLKRTSLEFVTSLYVFNPNKWQSRFVKLLKPINNIRSPTSDTRGSSAIERFEENKKIIIPLRTAIKPYVKSICNGLVYQPWRTLRWQGIYSFQFISRINILFCSAPPCYRLTAAARRRG